MYTYVRQNLKSTVVNAIVRIHGSMAERNARVDY